MRVIFAVSAAKIKRPIRQPKRVFSMTPFANTPPPPYYAVIFTSLRTDYQQGYADTAKRMVELAALQPGFLGAESVRDTEGVGITVSYWQDEAAIAAWKQQAEHRLAQERGKQDWYAGYRIRIAKVERAYSFDADEATV